MIEKRIPCPHCVELIQADAKKCHYCGEWLTRKPNSPRISVLRLVKTALLWLGCLILWLFYAGNTVDHSQAAYAANNGYGPMPSGYSIFILAILLAILLGRYFFSRKMSLSSISVRVVVIIIAVFGLYAQLSYDPNLSKLHEYRESLKWDYSGGELLEAMNDHRMSIGVQELQLDQRLCSNLVERWLDVRNPSNGHRGLKEWGEDNGLVKDGKAVAPFDNLNELYVTTADANRAIELWVGSPGHKVVLENPDYNVACTYASNGTGVAIVGFKEAEK